MMGPPQPVMPLLTPGRENAPLMAHMDSAYSGATTNSTMTPASIPPAGYFPNSAPPNTAYPPWTNSELVTPHAYNNPVHSAHASGSDGSRRPSLSASLNMSGGSDTGLPPGAMAPRPIGSSASSSQGIKTPTMGVTNAVGQEGRPEKATFNPSPAIAAPPPYSAANAYRL